MRLILIVVALSIPVYAISQPNCEIYRSSNEPCYTACLLSIRATGPQGSRQSQKDFDTAIELCPSFDYAYFEKSIPYLKRGEFATWKKLIDKAVELNPIAHLGYRGWCKYQFLRDYRGSLTDLEKLKSVMGDDIGYSMNGDYHLEIVRALCHKGIGDKQRAIDIIENQLSKPEYSPMSYDYLHLGIIKMEVGDVGGAIESLNKSIKFSEYLPDNYYYLGLLYKNQGKIAKSKDNLEKARAYYQKGYKRFDPYTHPMDQVFLSEIERELEN